ncbi:MAG TPA: mandelate racemase/muconate lactonizing enzyme family protein [Anaerolineaceae bacterium]
MKLRREFFPDPVIIDSIDVLKIGKRYFIQSRAKNGATGIAPGNQRTHYLLPLLVELIIPYFIGKDARQLDYLVDDIVRYKSVYKYAGIALWNCVGEVEFSLLDLLGKMANRTVGELFGPVIRKEIPIYLSSMRRDTTAAEEVAWLGERLAETQSKAVKFKIGGRMSDNADAFPERTNTLIPLARKSFGDDIKIYVDANGSYTADEAIRIGAMLEYYRVGWLEEPCPFWDYEQTRQVASALSMIVAGGEQDTSLTQWQWMADHQVVDLFQPDMLYNGGLTRALRVADIGEKSGRLVCPHSPNMDAVQVYLLQFASIVPNLGFFQEYKAEPLPFESWYQPHFTVRDGKVFVPDGPGLGMTYDSDFLKKAVIIRGEG